MPEAVNIGFAIGLPPEKAIEYFESKGYKISWDWRETWQEAHAKAFTVAGVTKVDVLQDIREALTDALKNGETLSGFTKNIRPILQRKGWWGKDAQIDKTTGEQTGKGLTPYRLKTIYQANMQTSYMVGRHAAMMANVESRPLWEYVAILDSRTRPAHRALDGKVFRYDDPFWDSFYPPNGFNCRCRVRARDKEDLRTSGRLLSNGYGRMEDINVPISPRRSLEVVNVTGYREPGTNKFFSPDPGWSYNPAKSWSQPILNTRLVQLDAPIGAALWNDVRPLVTSDTLKTFDSFVDKVLQDKKPNGTHMVVGAMQPQWVEQLAAHGVQPASANLSVTDRTILHTFRDAKSAQLSVDWYKNLPRHLQHPDAVVLDLTHAYPALLLFFKQPDSDKKLVVQIDYVLKKHGQVNLIETGKNLDLSSIKLGDKMKLIDGSL